MKAHEKKGVLDTVYEQISKTLVAGQYPIGTKLQPLREIASSYKISYITAQKVIKAFQMQGTLEARPGDGIYVVAAHQPLDGRVSDYLAGRKTTAYQAVTRLQEHTLCVVMPYWVSEQGGSMIYRIIRGILDRSDAHHWSVELIHNSGTLEEHESSHPKFIDKIEQRKPGGIIWLQAMTTHKMNIMRLADRGYTVVVTGRHFRDIPVACIQIDMQDMAEKVVGYFLERQIKNIGMLTGPIEGAAKDPHSIDIVSAIGGQMRRHGLDLPAEAVCQASFAPARAAIVRAFFENCREVEGLICLHEDVMETIEELERQGAFHRAKPVPMINTSGIFYQRRHTMKDIEMITLEWPLENIGKAAVQVFERCWVDGPKITPLDLSVQLPAAE